MGRDVEVAFGRGILCLGDEPAILGILMPIRSRRVIFYLGENACTDKML